ncbi:class F sortase [Streptomyces uncialis]|uniref:class F sortase n=1 Tax=Streptomyces uncialis TaxID=1048205 RepID=UPI00381C18EA
MDDTPQDEAPSVDETRRPLAPHGRDGPPKRRAGRRRALLAAAAVLTASAVALVTVGITRQESAPPQAATEPAAQGRAAGPPAGRENAPAQDPGQGHEGHGASAVSPGGTVLGRSVPERITVPALGVDSALLDLGLDSEQVMETPGDPDKAGWFTPGATPGERGPAVIAGHVTWNDKPAVFFELGKAEKGTRVEIGRADGKTAVFTVDRTVRYPKEKFPTLEVYRNLDHAGLRLITCGGAYNSTTNRYADNVVVYASLLSVR